MTPVYRPNSKIRITKKNNRRFLNPNLKKKKLGGGGVMQQFWKVLVSS
jgi:hypothetical protein